MDDFVASGLEQLRDEPPVAALPRCLGAHEDRIGLGERIRERRLPLRAPHAGRIAREGAEALEALLTGLAGAKPAELDRMAIVDAGRLQALGERLLVELRVASRRRIAPDVDERAASRFLQALDELLDGSPSVTDRVDLTPWVVHRIAPPMAETVTWDVLRELAEFRAEKGCAISLYVDLDPSIVADRG